MRSEVAHEDGRLLVTAIGSYTIFPPRKTSPTTRPQLLTRRTDAHRLTIAGSDSGGGAGIQADLKAFARCGVHGTSAITAITAQSTIGVSAIHPLPPEIDPRAGPHGDRRHPHRRCEGRDARNHGRHVAVAQALDELEPGTPVVVDPVMVAESGARLLEEDAERALIEQILPRAGVLTPNLLEARVLAARAIVPDEGEAGEVEELARALLALGPRAVVVTGGHRDRAVDLFLDASGAEPVEIPGERHPDGAAHGSGCTHSSLLAAQLALGRYTAAGRARRARADRDSRPRRAARRRRRGGARRRARPRVDPRRRR